jgi:CheY-like chemotaxis protein
MDVLLVEDSTLDAELIEIALKGCSFPLALNHCQDGDQAMQYLQQKAPYEHVRQPELILLDLNLPKKNGHEILQIIKSDPRLEDVPVIVLTTAALEKDIQQLSAFKKTWFFTKPFRFDGYKEIISCIEDMERKASAN